LAPLTAKENIPWKDIMCEEGAWEGKPGILRNGRAYGKGFLRRGTSVSGLQGNMKQAARPERSAPRVYIDRKLRILNERAAGFEPARRHILIGASRIEIEEQSMTS